MQSEFALFAGEIALRTRAQIEQCRLPRIEAVINRVDVLREQALEPGGRQFRENRQAVFRIGNIAPDIGPEAVDLDEFEQRTVRRLVRQHPVGRRAEDFPMGHVRLRADVHELTATHQLLG